MMVQIARAARALLDAGRTELAVRLDPPSLGTLHMRVVSDGAAVTAHLQVSTEASRELISDNLPALKQALAGAGIDIGQVSVSVDGDARENLAQPQSSPAQWRTVDVMAVQAQEAEAAAVLRTWFYSGGRHFDAFA